MNYLTRHVQSGLYSLGKLIRSPFASFVTCLIIGITLALPTILFVALKNINLMSNSFQQTLQVTLYLKNDITPGEVNQLLTSLRRQKDIKTVRAISPTEGFQELEKQAGFDSSLEKLTANPLPWTIVVQPDSLISTPEAFEKLAEQLKRAPRVESAQLDLLWVKRLASFIQLAQRLTYALAIFLSIAVLLIVNNTIRSTTEQRHKEIEVIKLIGGTHAFIRRPFLYAGMAYGLLGGMLAWLLVVILLAVLKTPVQHLAELYGSQFVLHGLGFVDLLILLGGSVTLGLIGSWVAVTKYLHQLQTT